MISKFVLFEKVSFRYESTPGMILHPLSASFPEGWTGVVGANGAGKTTVLKLACGLLKPREGSMNLPGNAVYCEQLTDDAPGLLESLIEAEDNLAFRVKGRLGILRDVHRRWASLSHGERKRSQIAVALGQAGGSP